MSDMGRIGLDIVWADESDCAATRCIDLEKPAERGRSVDGTAVAGNRCFRDLRTIIRKSTVIQCDRIDFCAPGRPGGR